MKTAIVFGHTSGLGLAVTNNLIDKGYKVIGFARSICDLQSKLLENVQVDLSEEKDINKTISLIKDRYSQFNHIIYCSGVLTIHNIDNLDYRETERLFKINTFAPMKIESGILPFIKQNEADVVNVTSSVLVNYYPTYEEYSSSKAALQKFTKDLQKELENTKCRVMDFCPGGFTSNIYKNMTGDKIKRDESKQMPAEEVAKILIFLLELPKKIEIPYIFVNDK